MWQLTIDVKMFRSWSLFIANKLWNITCRVGTIWEQDRDPFLFFLQWIGIFLHSTLDYILIIRKIKDASRNFDIWNQTTII